MAVGLIGVSVAMPGTAQAFWSGTAAGSGTARVATLPPPTVSASSPRYADWVDVAWTTPAVPSGMTLRGFVVSRVVGGASVEACGSTTASPLPPSATACSDTSLPDGTFDYEVTALVGSWTSRGGTSVPVTVQADRTAPTIRLSGADGRNARLAQRGGQPLLFFRPDADGSISIDAELTDDESGPRSATFPDVATRGWTHDAEVVKDGTGREPTIVYRSSTFAFARGAATPDAIAVVGTDDRGNAGSEKLIVVADGTGPTDGALSVNGAAAGPGGSTSQGTGAFTIESLRPYVEDPTESAVGLDTSTLIRESASLAGGTCGAFGGATEITDAPPVRQSGLADGCYRYTLTGTDLIGNTSSISTTVRIDTSAPTGGALTANGTDAQPAGASSANRTGAWSLSRADYVDPESGMGTSVLSRQAGTLTGGACAGFGAATVITGAPAESGRTTGCYRYDLTGTNAFGLVATKQVTVMVDTAVPTGGAVTVNGTVATGASPTSNNTSRTVTVSGLTQYSDANIGIATSTLTRSFATMSAGVCGPYGAGSAVVGSGTFTVTGLADGCHRFTLTGTDLAGNTASISAIVRVDATAPTGGTLRVNGVAAGTTMTRSFSRANPTTVVWTAFTDAASTMGTNVFARTISTQAIVTPCTTFTASAMTTPTAGVTTNVTLPTSGRCYRFSLTGTDALGNSAVITTEVWYDTTAPTSTGSLTVNGTAAATSTSTTGTYNVTALRTFVDPESGVASSVLQRTWAPVAANVCGAFDAATTITLANTVPIVQTTLPVGCYRYTQTGTNGVGGTLVATTIVRVDSTVPVGGALTVNGTSAAGTPPTSRAIAAFPIVRTDYTDPETTMTSSTLTRASTTLSNGVCGATYGAATTLTGAPSQTGLASGCYRYVLTGTNSLTLAASISTVVALDATVPTAGAFSVNGVAASAAGSLSTIAAAGSFSVTGLVSYADADSGLASSTLTRTIGVSTAGVCGAFDPASTTTIPGGPTITQAGLPNGCYRYVLTGVNGFGGTASVSSVVRVGP